MELYHLRTFVAVAHEGHLTRAAQKLFISQPSVSAHIKSLEQSLGLKLFERTPKGMRLTDKGNRLLPLAEQTLESAKQLQFQAKSLSDELTGVVRVGLNTDPLCLRIPQLLTRTIEKFPKLELKLTQSSSPAVKQDVKDGALDAGFIFEDANMPELEQHEIGTARLRIAGPPQWADKIKGADWNALSLLPWIWTPEDHPIHAIAGEQFRKNIRLTSAIQTDCEPILKALVTAGKGVSLILEEEALRMEQNGDAVLWDGNAIATRICFIYRKDKAHDPVISALLDSIRGIWE
ncbi:MAG: LysR family transcriptional regulator [Desulfovibrio sp.]